MRKIACLAFAAMFLLCSSVFAGEAFAAKKSKTHASSSSTSTSKKSSKKTKKTKKQVASNLPRVSGYTVSLPEGNLSANPGHEDIADFKRALTTAAVKN